MYKIVILKTAAKQLRRVPTFDRQRITNKLYALARDPIDSKLDVKKLSGEPGFRLRVGEWRVIFDRDDALKIIEIQRVGARGGIYK